MPFLYITFASLFVAAVRADLSVDQAVLNSIAAEINKNAGMSCTAPQLSKCATNKICHYTGACGTYFNVTHDGSTFKSMFVLVSIGLFLLLVYFVDNSLSGFQIGRAHV